MKPFRFHDETILTQTCLRSSSIVPSAIYRLSKNLQLPVTCVIGRSLLGELPHRRTVGQHGRTSDERDPIDRSECRRSDPGLPRRMGRFRHASPCCRPGDGSDRSFQSDDERNATAQRALCGLFLRVQLSCDRRSTAPLRNVRRRDRPNVRPVRPSRHGAPHRATQRDGRTGRSVHRPFRHAIDRFNPKSSGGGGPRQTRGHFGTGALGCC
jgi:hypothetical protein